MGVLADIYSGGNTLKRKLNAFLADPVGEINTGSIRAREDYNKLTNLFANAYPMAGDKTVLNSPQQIAQFQREAADKAGEMGLAGATVWHGSPHKFDKFDSSKIGTGEGAQAYGHGLYLAESPDVAGGYAKMVYKKNHKASDTADSLFLDRWNAVSNLEKQKAAGVTKFGAPWDATWEKRLGETLADAEKRGARPENLYKVDLPDKQIAKMLDYDNRVPDEMLKPLSDAAMRDFGSGATGTSGEKLYKETVFNFKMMGHENPTQAATDWLTKQGVPGMRYLDGGSRSAGKGSSNFVVFPGNEGLLNIMERNGQPVNQLQKLLK